MASLVNDEAADLTLVALLAESPGKNQVRKYVSCDDLPRGARSGDRAEVRLLSRTCILCRVYSLKHLGEKHA